MDRELGGLERQYKQNGDPSLLPHIAREYERSGDKNRACELRQQYVEDIGMHLVKPIKDLILEEAAKIDQFPTFVTGIYTQSEEEPVGLRRTTRIENGVHIWTNSSARKVTEYIILLPDGLYEFDRDTFTVPGSLIGQSGLIQSFPVWKRRREHPALYLLWGRRTLEKIVDHRKKQENSAQ